MNLPSDPPTIERLHAVLQQARLSLADLEWLQQSVGDNPEWLRIDLPDGRCPLRATLSFQDFRRGLFRRFIELGADHDLLTACAACDLAAVERILAEDPASIYSTDSEGNTPLHWTGIRGYVERCRDICRIVHRLCAAGADVNQVNRYGETPIDRQLEQGTEDALEAYAEYETAPNLRLAIAVDDVDWMEDILADAPNALQWVCPRTGKNLLHFAINRSVSTELFGMLLAKLPTDQIEVRSDPHQRTPLLMAIHVEEYDFAELLIDAGARLDVVEIRDEQSHLPSQSALEKAVINDRVGLAERLIAGGADPQQGLKTGGNLLHVTKSAEMAELLVGAGADPSEAVIDLFGSSRLPLDCVMEEGRSNVVRVLVRHCSRTTFFTHVVLGDLPRVASMLDKQPELIRAFNCPMDVEPDTDAAEEGGVEWPHGSYGGTGLHYAAKTNSLDMVELLLERGADVNAMTHAKWTPLHDAVYYTMANDLRNGEATIRRLFAAGADLHAETIGGARPIDIAEFLNFFDRSCDVFDLLRELEQA